MDNHQQALILSDTHGYPPLLEPTVILVKNRLCKPIHKDRRGHAETDLVLSQIARRFGSIPLELHGAVPLKAALRPATGHEFKASHRYLHERG